MKKKILFILIYILIINTIFAKENALKLMPLRWIGGLYGIQFERVVSNIVSAELGLGYYTRSEGNTKISKISFNPAARFYFGVNKLAPRGWYVSPEVEYVSLNATYNNSTGKRSASRMVFGATMWYQWVFEGVFFD